MNQGGEPAHDDYGLPRVDIEIPDDARELDRDVQAYHRELRALRRIERSNRWRAPLRKSGMLVPLIAGCLVLAMIGGMVLTMFSANPNFDSFTGRKNPPATTRPSGAAGQTSARPSGPASAPARVQSPAGSVTASASAAASVLPTGTIATADRVISLQALITTAIAIIPANCHCTRVIARLVARANLAKVKVYLVGLRGSSVRDLRDETPPSAAGAILAIDKHNTLGLAYPPAGSLTVLLVDKHRRVRVTPKLGSDVQLDRALRALKK